MLSSRSPDFRRPPSVWTRVVLPAVLAAALVMGTVAVTLTRDSGGTGGTGEADGPGASGERSPSERAPVAEPSPEASSVPPGQDAVDGDLFVNPDGQAQQWADAHPNDDRQPLIAERIAAQPQATWFVSYEPGSVTREVRAITSRAEAVGETPVLVSYLLPNRDCGGASSGGAPDLARYDAWLADFAAGLGDRPVLVILEPDSLALDDCLSADQRRARHASLARAGETIHAANPQVRVYFDAGNSHWHDAAEMASRLAAAGVLESGDGIFTNVSNFRTTADEVAYAKAVLAELAESGGTGGRPHAVIDTSRNGNGPAGDDEWCDPAGRRIGENPTTDPGDPAIDAYLWVKPPGEADGCAAAAGTFSPDLANRLAGGRR